MLIYPQLFEGHLEPGDRKRKRHVSKKMGASPVEGNLMLSLTEVCVGDLRELIDATTIARPPLFLVRLLLNRTAG